MPLYVNELRNRRNGHFLKWISGHPLPDRMGEEMTVEVYILYIKTEYLIERVISGLGPVGLARYRACP